MEATAGKRAAYPRRRARLQGRREMPRLALALFTAAFIYGICGMLWGAYMASTDIFTLATARTR